MFSPTNSLGQGSSPATLFTDPAAVEAWDRWYRWREGGVLRDLTIDATWRRVADAVSQVEGDQSGKWAGQFVDAFSRWRILPDPRLLRVAGTGKSFAAMDDPCAVVNAAAFVAAPGLKRASFERESFVEATALAVRLLDDVLLASDRTATRAQPRIGLIGVADALHLLGLPYDGREGRQCAADMAAALAEGALRGATDLAAERGAAGGDRPQLADHWRRRGAPACLVDAVLNSGMRHELLTTIEPQPQLALLANNASDALDPRPVVKPLPPSRAACTSSRNAETDAPILAQIEIRAAMQPWIDSPIDYPLVCTGEPDVGAIEKSKRLATQHGLRPLTLRCARAWQMCDDDAGDES